MRRRLTRTARKFFRTCLGLGRVVGRNESAERDAAEEIHLGQHGVEDHPAHVLEVDIDASRTGCLEIVGEVAGLVVDGRIESEFLSQITALLCARDDADDSKAFDLADLSDNGSDGAGGRGHHERFASLRLADFEQPEIRRPTWHPQPTDPPLERRLVRVDLERQLAVDNGMALHSEETHNGIAGGEARMSRSDHVACGVGAHHVTQADWRDIGFPFAHPTAHGGIERDESRLDRDLAVSQRRNGLSGQGEVVARGQAARAALQTNEMVLSHRLQRAEAE